MKNKKSHSNGEPMMKAKTSLMILSSLLLVGCSSGGGNSSHPYLPDHYTNNSSTATTVHDEGDNYFAMVNEHALREGAIKFKNADKLDQITVEGLTFNLASDVNTGIRYTDYPEWTSAYGSGIRTGKDKLPENISPIHFYSSPNLVVGILGIHKPTWHQYAYINGHYTPENTMPKGRATYDTRVAMFSHYKEKRGYNTHSDSSRVTKVHVDFDNKVLKATINDVPYDNQDISDPNAMKMNLELRADIKGNTFESAKSDPVRVKGGFFGKDANEIGGIFKKENNIGAFGGKISTDSK